MPLEENELRDLDFDALVADLVKAPVCMRVALGNGAAFTLLLVLGGRPPLTWFRDGTAGVADIDGVGQTALWVAVQGQGAYPFHAFNKDALASPMYVAQKLGLAGGDAPQVAYLIGSVRARLQGERLDAQPGFARWVLRAPGWSASDDGRLPAPVQAVFDAANAEGKEGVPDAEDKQ